MGYLQQSRSMPAGTLLQQQRQQQHQPAAVAAGAYCGGLEEEEVENSSAVFLTEGLDEYGGGTVEEMKMLKLDDSLDGLQVDIDLKTAVNALKHALDHPVVYNTNIVTP